MPKRALSLFIALLTVAVVAPSQGAAHEALKIGRYECWLWEIHQYSNFDLKLQDGGRYTFMLNDGSWKRSGRFAREGDRIRFTSGYLKKKGFKGLHDSYTSEVYGTHTHLVYLYKNTYDDDNLKYDCNNN
ncbi:MAG: hypothetical protein M3198_01925 [Actinomycetota bacterium]|nr:hypothetical protein [Actinomycetota bacterium]